MKPHLVRWHGTYGEKGLVVIDVDNGAYDPEFKDVLADFNAHPLPFPVLWDEKGRMSEQYGAEEEGTPWTVILGLDGATLWKGHPLDKIGEIETVLEAELAKLAK